MAVLTGLDWIGRLRLGSGIILFAFVGTHLLNHALGLISLPTLETGRIIFLATWRNPVGTTLLYGAVIVHIVLVVYSIVRRRTWKIPPREALQVIFGLAVPPLIAIHVIGNRLAYELFDLNDTYAYVLLSTWIADPWQAVRLIAALIAAWLHGCLGMHMWLRLKPWYAKNFTYLYTLAFVLPLLGLAGYASAGREVELLLRDPDWLAAAQQVMNFPDDMKAAVARVYAIQDTSLAGMAAVLLVLPLIRYGRYLIDKLRGAVVITYPGRRRVTTSRGATVLDASRSANIPHASVCGGRGRCSTCRVRCGKGRENLAAPSDEEARVLKRVGAATNVRLACQIRPTHDLDVIPLLPPNAEPQHGFEFQRTLQGNEREIAIMFADIRAFTQFSEKKLPYDVVFVLNQYFRSMGTAIEHEGGYVDKFIGDGIMALFGLSTTPAEACQQALMAAQAMGRAMVEMNESLADDLEEPLRIGIGIHTGSAIVGEMGHGRVKSVTAIGDVVNTASRLEPMTKEFKCQLVVSNDVARLAGVDLSAFPTEEVTIRGREEKMQIHLLLQALDLPVGKNAAAAPKPAEPKQD
ncbi:MAG: adenylate/guanylate cyclase domain-containing protein, partial [Proteobacteria bacterium]|nr:adenylate/guanylate cyclase domain-containing protein [Pseudomonadota bacterium]